MMKFKVLLFLSFFVANTTFAQDTKDDIIKPINELFDGFRTSDSAKVAAAFFDRAPFLGTSFSRNAVPLFRKDAGLQQILQAVSQPKADSVKWDERIYNLNVSQDDGLATVYCPYSFYVGNTFSHCGVNFFTLTKTTKGWKILSIVDTRRKDKCIE